MPVERLPALLLDDAAVYDGVVADNQPFKGFDGQQATSECGYVVNGRLHAVRGTQGETLYGKLSDKVVTRTDGGWIASWWLDKDDPLGKAKGDIGAADSTSINAEAVRIDDAELLGTSGRMPGGPNLTQWIAGVTGGLVATVLGTPIPLRPDRAERRGNEVIFTEQRRGSGAVSTHSLSIRWNYAAPDTKQQRIDQGITLHASAALLMDEVADGAWEAGSPLWIRTAGGFLRWHFKVKDLEQAQEKEGRLSYRTAAESRTADVTGWLPEIPANGFARLLLDSSGDKILTVDTSSRTATLEIQDPALMIAVPRACCNGCNLAVPLLPPDDAAVTGTLCIVSQALAPSGQLNMMTVELEALPARLVLSAPSSDGASQYFAPAGNWVRPAESAANCSAGIARARVLLPHPIDATTFRLVLGDDLTVSGLGDFDRGAATSVNLPSVDGKPRSVSGPLARFDIQNNGVLPKPAHYGGEIWPSPLEGEPPQVESSNEPAVLRGLYRRSSAQGSFAADRLPPYTATRLVAAAIDTPKLARYLIEKADTRWHSVRAAADAEAVRLRFHPKDPNTRRGWVDGINFVGRISRNQGPIDYLQLNGATHVSNWLRLSNDTLVSREATSPAADATDPSQAESQANSPAILPFVTKLGEGDKPEERGSLALFILQETLPTAVGGSPTFLLQLDLSSIGQGPVKIALDSLEDRVVVNRLVIAAANPKLGERPAEQDAAQEPMPLKDSCGLVLKTLNRLYLELEREGGQFIVRRGMVGWSAKGAFGLLADDKLGLEVTEMFERKDGALSRTVEFNGALSVVGADAPIKEVSNLNNQAYCLTAYLWAATWKYAAGVAAPTLRVIGYHGWSYQGKTRWFASMQDARVVNGELDLSADLVLMLGKTESESDSRGTDSPWQAVRRHLYSVTLDTPLGTDSQPSNKIVGFLTLRYADAHKFTVNLDTKARHLKLIPDWRAAEHDIVPIFSDLPRPARPERPTWLRPKEGQEQRLNAGMDAGSPGKGLSVVLHAFTEDVQPGTIAKLFACCLVGEIGSKAGIPRWVPAPLLGGYAPPARPAKSAEVPAAPVRMCRLWLFDGPPRMAAEWPDDVDHTPTEVASKTLARLGWTREAVLETDPGTGPGAVTWTVVDSPLLNRDASIGWFGWPLRAPGDTDKTAVWPQDVLPRTRPVPQFEAKAPRAFSIEVAFEEDRPRATAGATPATTSPLLIDLAPTEPAINVNVTVPIKLRSAGLRAGAWHRLVDYDPNEQGIKCQMFVPTDLPEREAPRKVILDAKTPGIWVFRWDERRVDVLNIVHPLDSTPGNSCLLVVPNEALFVKVIQCDDNLVIYDQFGTGQKVDRMKPYPVWPDPTGQKRLGIRMPSGKPFRTLVVEFCTGTENALVVQEQCKYFDGGAERLAGVFNSDGVLQAFGTEQVVFYPDVTTPGKLEWRRVAQWQCAAGLGHADGNWYIATVDIEGRFTYYGQ